MARPLEKKKTEGDGDDDKKKGTWGQGDNDEGSGDETGSEEVKTSSTSNSNSTSPEEEEPDTSTFVPEDKWRKSSQWASLTRKHAAAVVADTKIDATFRSICHFREWDDELERKYLCFSDEHYIPTLLAIRGWDVETDCFGYNVHTDWTEGGAHPVRRKSRRFFLKKFFLSFFSSSGIETKSTHSRSFFFLLLLLF